LLGVTNKAAGTVPIVAAAAVWEVARLWHEPQKDVLKKFLQSKTYASLLDFETGLFADGHFVIADRFMEESENKS
jgi:hypothetical protein